MSSQGSNSIRQTHPVVRDDTTHSPFIAEGDGDINSLHITSWVWDSGLGEWVKMAQPTIEAGDLYVAVDDLEQYILDKLDQYKFSDWLVDSTDVYLGFLDKSGAWYIQKFDTTAGSARYVAGASSYDFSDPASLSYDTFSATF